MELIEKEVIVKYVKTDFGDFPLYELLEILEELEDTDPFGCSLVIYDSKLKEWLISEGVIRSNVRKSVYKTDKFEEFYSKVSNLTV